MRLTIWDHPAAAFLVSGLDATPYAADTDVVYTEPAASLDMLLSEQTDVALVQTLEALTHAEQLDVLPAVALSSWQYPFARLTLSNGLGSPPDRVVTAEGAEQENVVARIILKEHYGMMPEFVEEADDAAAARIQAGRQLRASADGTVLDLGQEWFELSGYPMIWGVFAARKGAVDEALIRRIRGIVRTSEDQKSLFLRAHDLTPEMHDFYSEHLRVRFDDLAIAGLTEFRQYLFYFGILDDVTELPVVFIDDEDADNDQGSKPLI